MNTPPLLGCAKVIFLLISLGFLVFLRCEIRPSSPLDTLAPPFTIAELNEDLTLAPLHPFFHILFSGKKNEWIPNRGLRIVLGEKEKDEDCVFAFTNLIPLYFLPDSSVTLRIDFEIKSILSDDLCVGVDLLPAPMREPVLQIGGCVIRGGGTWYLHLGPVDPSKKKTHSWAIGSPRNFHSFSFQWNPKKKVLKISGGGKMMEILGARLPQPLAMNLYFLTGIVHPEELPDKKVVVMLKRVSASLHNPTYYFFSPGLNTEYDTLTLIEVPKLRFFNGEGPPLPLTALFNPLPVEGVRNLNLFLADEKGDEFYLLSPLSLTEVTSALPTIQIKSYYPGFFLAQGKGKDYRKNHP